MRNMSSIEQTIIKLAATAYGVEESTIAIDTDIREEISNQSIKLLAFISSIEDELDVTLDMSEMTTFITIRDFVEKVRQLTQ